MQAAFCHESAPPVPSSQTSQLQAERDARCAPAVRLLFQHARKPLDAYWLKDITDAALDARGVGGQAVGLSEASPRGPEAGAGRSRNSLASTAWSLRLLL